VSTRNILPFPPFNSLYHSFRLLGNYFIIFRALYTYHTYHYNDCCCFSQTERLIVICCKIKSIPGSEIRLVSPNSFAQFTGGSIQVACTDIQHGTWNKDGAPLPKDAYVSTKGDLIIRTVRMDHAGKYHCQSKLDDTIENVFVLYVGGKIK